MAPQGPRKSQPKVQQRDEEEPVEQNNSQENHGLAVLDMAREMVVKARARRDAGRKTIQDQHVKRTKDLSNAINSLFEKRKNRVTKIQKSSWDRLDALNKKRSMLEASIIARMKAIEQHTYNIAGEMSAMLQGRMEEAQSSQA